MSNEMGRTEMLGQAKGNLPSPSILEINPREPPYLSRSVPNATAVARRRLRGLGTVPAQSVLAAICWFPGFHVFLSSTAAGAHVAAQRQPTRAEIARRRSGSAA